MPSQYPSHLLLPDTGRIMVFTEAQWRKPDTIACDPNGTPVAGFKKPDLKQNRTSRLEARRGVKPAADDIPEGAPVERVAPARVDTSAEPELNPEEAARESDAKAKLIKFAKDRFGVALDPADPLKVIEARVNRLANSASPVAAAADATAPKKAKRTAKPKAK